MHEAEHYGRYKVEKVIGRGAMGVVYLATDPVIGRKVAIKVIQAHPGIEPQEFKQLQARFEREFQSAGTLSHPNIVTVHDVGQEGDCSFIAMEYVRGESLQAILASNRVFSFKQTSDLVLQIADALDYAHERGIVHRDIKPANIMVTREGRPKITDFGVAKLATTTLTRTGTVVGTPSYMSPEQVTGHAVTGASDQFSVAVVLYQLLTGELPFTGDRPTTIMYKIVHEDPIRPGAINRRLPDSLDRVLMRALEKDPDKRYPRSTELAEGVRLGLGAAPADATVLLRPPDSAEPVVEPKAGKRWPIGVGAAAAAVALLSFGLWAWVGGVGEPTPAGPEEAEPPALFSARVEVTSEPPGAEIWIDGESSGEVTPASVPLQGSDGQTVQLELRRGGTVLAMTELTLGPEMPSDWTATLPALPEEPVGTPLEPEAGGGEDDPEAEAAETYRVTSSPAGARVYFDGELLEERTPARIEVSVHRQHQIRVESDDYGPQSWSFSLDDLSQDQRTSGELFFNLVPVALPGFIVLDNAPYPVSVEVRPMDGSAPPKTSGPAPRHEIDLLPGRYQLVLSAPDVHYREERTVTLESEDRLDLGRLPPAVTVRVFAFPENCRVSVDESFVGVTPFDLTIVVGTHEFTYEWPTLDLTKSQTESITRNGQQLRVSAQSQR